MINVITAVRAKNERLPAVVLRRRFTLPRIKPGVTIIRVILPLLHVILNLLHVILNLFQDLQKRYGLRIKPGMTERVVTLNLFQGQDPQISYGACNRVSFYLRIILTTVIMTPLNGAVNWPQLGHTTACVTGISSAIMLGKAIHAEQVIARERIHLLNNLLLSQPPHQRQRANLVSRLNQLSRKQTKLRWHLYLWAGILSLHFFYAGAYLHYRIKK